VNPVAGPQSASTIRWLVRDRVAVVVSLWAMTGTR